MGIEQDLDWVKWNKSDMEKAFALEKKRIINIVKNVLEVKEERTFENTLLPLSMVFDDNLQNTPIYFLQSISTDKEVRELSQAFSDQIVEFFQKEFFQGSVYEVVYYFKNKKKQIGFDSAKQEIFNRLLEMFEKSGFTDGNPEKNPKVAGLIEKIAKLQNAYTTNMSAKVPVAKLSKKQLEGLPESFLSNLKIENNKYVIPVGFGSRNEILKFAKDRSVRQKIDEMFLNRGGQKNLKILKELIELRGQLAILLGFKNHNEMAISKRMAGTVNNVNKFVNESLEKLEVVNKSFRNELGVLAKKDGILMGDFKPYDTPFYSRVYREEKLGIDLRVYSKYLPYQETIKKIFDFLGYNFAFKAEKVNLPVWHESVFWYQISDSKSNEILGYFAFDLIPRDGKDSHAGSHSTMQDTMLDNGKRRVPVSVIISNDVVKDDPNFELSFSMIETFFHEMGHGLHSILSQAKYSLLAGTSTDRDFVEVPSMGIEKYANDIDCLKKIFTGKMTKEEETKIENYFENKMLVAVGNYRGLVMSEVDLTWHGKNKAPDDLTVSMNKIIKKRGMSVNENGHFASSWIHMALGGYCSGFYGYFYSDSIASDMFSKFSLGPKEAMQFRKEILEQGSMRPEKDSIKAFLGRPANNKNWLSEMGVSKTNKKS